MSIEDTIPELDELNTAVEPAAPAPDPGFISQNDLRALFEEERRLNGGTLFGPPSTPAPTPPQPETPPSAEDVAKQNALDALDRAEERVRLDRGARALLLEQNPWMTEADLHRMTQAERLAEAGLVLTDEQRREREFADNERRLRSDPALLERALREREIETLTTNWIHLSPIARERKARDLGLDPTEIDRTARDAWNCRVSF